MERFSQPDMRNAALSLVSRCPYCRPQYELLLHRQLSSTPRATTLPQSLERHATSPSSMQNFGQSTPVSAVRVRQAGQPPRSAVQTLSRDLDVPGSETAVVHHEHVVTTRTEGISSAWSNAASKLLKRLPREDQWEDRLHELQYHTVFDTTSRLVLSNGQTTDLLLNDAAAPNDVIRVGRRLVQAAKKATAVSRLIDFIFISFTIVMLRAGYDNEVHQMSSELADYDQFRWRRIRQGVLGLHAVAKQLITSYGWPECRTIELIFLSGVHLCNTKAMLIIVVTPAMSLYEVIRDTECTNYIVCQLGSHYSFQTSSSIPGYSDQTIVGVLTRLTTSFSYNIPLISTVIVS